MSSPPNGLSPTPIAQDPTPQERYLDWGFRGLTRVLAWLAITIIVLLILQIMITAFPAIRSQGLQFFTSSTWFPGRSMDDARFGILNQILGTLYSSILGVGLGGLFGVTAAIVLTQNFLHPRLELALKNIIDLLAAIPSVVYGLWGLQVVIPILRPIANGLHENVGGPLFSTPLVGPGLLPAVLVLAIMVLPTVTALSRDALAAVPPRLTEAAYGLGATRWEMILRVALPTASQGIFGAIILAFGRAVGETMALAMLFGNTNNASFSLFAPGNTLAALIANQWPEASKWERGGLMYAGLVLLGLTLLINILGVLVIRRSSPVQGR